MGKEDFEYSERITDLQTIVELFRVYAKLDIANQFLVYFDGGNWSTSIILCFRSFFDHDFRSDDGVFLCELLGLIKDLTFRSTVAERLELLCLQKESLLQILFDCCERCDSMTPKMKETITAVMWNFALDSCTRKKLLFREGRHSSVILNFLFAVLSETSTKTYAKDTTAILRTKRNAISVIGNFFSDNEYHSHLHSVEETQGGSSTLRQLLDQVGADCDAVVRRRAMRALRCLTQSTHPEMRRVIRQEEVILVLVESISRNVSFDDENDRDMQLQAFYAVANITDSFSQKDWPLVETTILQRIVTTTDPKLIHGGCKCLVECFSISPWKRSSSCFSELFWMRLETAMSAHAECYDPVSRLILVLAKHEHENRHAASQPAQAGILVSPSVLNCLTMILEAPSHEHEASRSRALDSIMLLIENETNKCCIAKNENLLSGLVNLCLLQPQRLTKQNAKDLILQLVPVM